MVNPDNYGFIGIIQSESFWVAVAFFIFIALSFNKLKKILIQALDNRIIGIKKKIDEIKKIKFEAQNNLYQAKKNLKNIIEEKTNKINSSKEQAVDLKKKLLQDEINYKNRAEKKIKDKIEQSKKQTIEEIQKIILQISVKSISQFLKSKKNLNENNLVAKSIENLINQKKQS